jgi:hypothetical protein
MAVFFLVLVFALLLSVLWPRLKRVGRCLAIIALIAVTCQGLLFFPFVSKLLSALIEIDQPISAAQLEQTQVIVIIGGGVEWVRARYGAALQSSSGLPILVSGGNPTGPGSEAENMKKVIQQQYNGHVRWIESASTNTAENAQFSAKLLHRFNITRIALVTDPWHMSRAALMFREQGLEVYPAPVILPDERRESYNSLLPNLSSLRANMRLVRELLGRLDLFKVYGLK